MKPLHARHAHHSALSHQTALLSLIERSPSPKGRILHGIKLRRARLAILTATACILDLWDSGSVPRDLPQLGGNDR